MKLSFNTLARSDKLGLVSLRSRAVNDELEPREDFNELKGMSPIPSVRHLILHNGFITAVVNLINIF